MFVNLYPPESHHFFPNMIVPYGFSVGDFTAALELIGTVIDALHAAGDSSRRYRGLIRELYSLETALREVKRIELHEFQSAEKIALQFAASQCQLTIDEFWMRIVKYQPYLGNPNGRASRAKEAWMKVRWAVFKQEEMDSFRTELRSHTGSIQLLIQASLM